MPVTGRRLEHLLDVNPHEALPRRGTSTLRPPRPGPRVQTGSDEFVAFRYDTEAYRMRTRPELYDEWMVEIVLDHRQAVARNTGTFNYDCHTCHSTLYVTADAVACPRCGHKIPE